MRPTDPDEPVTPNRDDELDARRAAELLDESTREARRQFDLHPPLLTALLAILVLVAYAALWLSTRGQHPYRGPSGGAIALVYVVVALSAAAGARVYRRATVGVGGASIRQQRIEGVALGVSFLGSPVIQGALYHYHASDAIVYGVIPAAGPLIVVGTTMLGIAGVKGDWPQFWAALTAVIGGTVALFVGPSGAWLAAGIGLFVAVVGFALVHARTRARTDSAWATRPSTR